MRNYFLPAGAFAHEGEGGGEDGLAALSGLHGAGAEGAAFAHVLDVVDDGDVGVAVEDEVAVHAVDGEGVGDGALGGGEALGYGCAALCTGVSLISWCDIPNLLAYIYASRSWRMPEGTGVGEEVGLDFV